MKSKFHDIIPPDKRSIRNIPIPRRGHGASSAKHLDMQDEVSNVDIRDIDHINHTERASHAEHSHHKKTDAQKATKKHSSTTRARKGAHAHKDTTEYEPAFYQADESILDKDLYKEEAKLVAEETAIEEEMNAGKKKSFKFKLISVLVLIVAIFGFATHFAQATVSIKLLEKSFGLNDIKVSLEDIRHDAIQQTFSKSVDVKANGTKKVEEKATGVVVLYNNYSSSAQKLAIETRLEIPEGLVYKTTKEVTIPGMKTVSGKKVPGSVEVTVRADQAGDKYNKGMRDFAIVAYRNSDRYKAIYGRSKTSLSGGFSGTVPDISETDLNLAIKDLKATIKESINSSYATLASKKETPYTYVANTYVVTYQAPKQTVAKDGKKAEITLEASSMGIIFDTEQLSTYLANKFINGTNTAVSTSTATTSAGIADTSAGTTSTDDTVNNSDKISKRYIATFDEMKIDITPDTTLTMLNTNTGDVLLSGKTSISSILDETVLKKAISGLSIDQATSIVQNIVDFTTLKIKVLPWWVKKMPKIDSIEIELLS